MISFPRYGFSNMFRQSEDFLLLQPPPNKLYGDVGTVINAGVIYGTVLDVVNRGGVRGTMLTIIPDLLVLLADRLEVLVDNVDLLVHSSHWNHT